MVDIPVKRIQNLIEELYQLRYSSIIPMKAEVTTAKNPIPFENLNSCNFTRIEQNEIWGEIWDSSWFRFNGKIPKEWKGKEIVALIDIDGEGCVFKNGEPYCGLTYKRIGNRVERKRRVMIAEEDIKDGSIHFLVEGAANALLGHNLPGEAEKPFFRLVQADLAIFNRAIWDLAMDMEFLLHLYKAIDPVLPRAKRIIGALSKVANLTPLTDNISEAREITKAMIDTPATASEMTAWSVGHAHLDLGWLWRFRETRRKAGRTFSTALRMIEEYPDFIFGASQPQLFEWVKEDYPQLYKKMQEAVREGRIECQGGMWVEPDMNITEGEALVRQCIYGKRFFRDEFGKDVRNLWLPDVFGYSAALPQILRKSGIDFFVTQKISWNETNTFPHHTFLWYGIDGTPVKTHFLPTNDYNSDNEPDRMIKASLRFAQSGIHDGFLNLFGIGDGGGGPSRRHIEWAVRGKNCEGVPKMRMEPAESFLAYLEKQPSEELPVWRGELYLELHRGTYTTQALIKKYNRKIVLKLKDVELLGAMNILNSNNIFPDKKIRKLWKDTLLHQFHDVLPGSSIHEVYQDANSQNEKNMKELHTIEDSLLKGLTPELDSNFITFFNTLSWNRTEIVNIEGSDAAVSVPSMGYVQYSKKSLLDQEYTPSEMKVSEDCSHMENSFISVKIKRNGNIGSIVLKETGQEFIHPEGAGVFKLYEDKPYDWDAWEVSSYYIDTVPEYAELVSQRIVRNSNFVVMIEQKYTVGCSSITQILEIRSGEALVRSTCKVHWNESKKMLRLFAATNILSDKATYEIQYGSIERPTHSNTSWDEAKFEVCGHRFGDLSQADRGLALLNDCKYGYRIYQNFMELNLLRSPTYPDDQADRGFHEFQYAYLPHLGTCNESDVIKLSHTFNNPLIQISGRRFGNNATESFFSVSSEEICIEVVKPAEKGEGIVMRCYETKGGGCHCHIRTHFPFAEVYEVNLLEEERELISHSDSKEFSSTFSPYEIKTFMFF